MQTIGGKIKAVLVHCASQDVFIFKITSPKTINGYNNTTEILSLKRST